MRIMNLNVQNFRGISELDWSITDRLVPLVGKGDSGKSTILESLDILFNGSRTLLPTDDYFPNADINISPSIIQATVIELPEEFEQSERIAHSLCGYDLANGQIGELLPDREPCIIVRMTMIPDSLPKWELIGYDGDIRTSISQGDRETLGFLKIDNDVDKHLTWGDRSVLRRGLDERRDADLMVIAALRTVEIDEDHWLSTQMSTVIHAVSDKISNSGAYVGSDFASQLRPDHLTRGGSWALTDNSGVPLLAYGLGSKRLIALALQESLIGAKSCVVIDEVEIGLEPHRLSRLLQNLERRIENNVGQVFFTTHAQRVIEHMGSKVQIVTRDKQGKVTVVAVPCELRTKRDGVQGVVRSHAAALLAGRIVIVEGATESGLVRRLCQKWDETSALNSNSLGIEYVEAGGGSKIAPKALAFIRLGYDVIVLIDNDTDTSDQDIQTLVAAGAVVCATKRDHSIEQDIFPALTRENQIEAIQSAVKIVGIDSVSNRLRTVFGQSVSNPEDLKTLTREDYDRLLAIAVSGKASPIDNILKQEGGIFKTQDGGTILAEAIHAMELESSAFELPEVLVGLRHAIYGSVEVPANVPS